MLAQIQVEYKDKRREWVEVEDAQQVTFPGFESLGFFVHRAFDRYGYTVSEESSGHSVCICYNKEVAIECAQNILEQHGLEKVKKVIERYAES